jgi:2-C-methyl-D-erythritol 4-phosphate cytidylyltransferase
MFSLVLLAGGIGSRMNNNTPKQFLKIGGKPIIVHSLEHLDFINEIIEIIIACPKEHIQTISDYKCQFGLKRNYTFAESGITRQETVFNGLKKAHEPLIIIHEAARPFVRKRDFITLVEDPHENIIYTRPINFTAIKASTKVEGILNRNNILNVQLPQKFNKKALLEAHKIAFNKSLLYTEDASLLFDISNAEIYTLMGFEYNIKITEPLDLLLGEVIYNVLISDNIAAKSDGTKS